MQKKKVVSTALADANVKKMEELILTNIRTFLTRIGENELGDGKRMAATKATRSTPKNMSVWPAYLSFDVMGDICFHGSFNMLNKPDNRYILDVLPKGVNGLNVAGHMPAIVRMKIGDFIFSGLKKHMLRYERFARDMSEKRLRKSPAEISVRDVYSFLLESNEKFKPGEPLLFTPGEIVGSAITTTIFYLQGPGGDSTLFENLEEIRSGPILNSCKYIRACIDEGMRISPGVPGLNPREVLAGGTLIDGHFFPEGTDLGVSHYAIHHNEDYYPESYKFMPERWIPGAAEGVTEDSVALCQSAFTPFSIGPRGCVGKHVAYKELMVVIGRILWLYDMRLAPGSTAGEANSIVGNGAGQKRRSEMQMKDMFVAQHDGPMVEFKPRV